MIKNISYRFNMAKPEDREEFQIMENACLANYSINDFQNRLRTLCKHGDLTGKDPHDVAQDVREMFYESFKDYFEKVGDV